MKSQKHKHRWSKWVIGVLAVILVLLIAARIYLHDWVLDYVNKSLNNIPGYRGSVRDIDIALYRGAYKMYDLKIDRKSGKIPVPFVNIAETDLSIQWGALFHGRIVSNVTLTKPILNFAKSQNDKQTGAGVDWTKPIKDLSPIDVNYVKFSQGKLTYQDFSADPKVNVYINNMSGEIRNLRNVVDKSVPMPSSLIIRGDSIGTGKLDVQGRMNILKEVPDMDLNTKLEDVNLTALNNYFKAYAFIDVHKGSLSVYSEVIVKNGQVSGYIKPIATGIEIVDLKDANPIKLAWESVVSTVVTVFTNQSKDQFATKIPLSGSLKNVDTSIWPTIGGIIRNAFVQAFNKGLDRDPKEAK